VSPVISVHIFFISNLILAFCLHGIQLPEPDSSVEIRKNKFPHIYHTYDPISKLSNVEVTYVVPILHEEYYPEVCKEDFKQKH
jgi:hypothetical protein